MSLAEQIARATGWLANGYKPVPCLKHDAPKFIMRNGEEEKNSPGKRPHSDLWHDKERPRSMAPRRKRIAELAQRS